ncbi:MAG: hypothetical protein R3F59_19530 [Myxococcota bacterium]
MSARSGRRGRARTRPEAPDAARLAQAQRYHDAGVAASVGGAAAMAGGVVVLLVGRGKRGELSDESQLVDDVRSIGGLGLVIGGLTSVLVGGDRLGKAHALRHPTVSASLSRDGAGLVLTGRW